MPAPIFSAEVTGLEVLDRALQAIGTAASNAVLTRALVRAAQPVVDDAKRFAPYDPSPARGAGRMHLRNSIVVSTKLKKRARIYRVQVGGVAVFVGPTVPHGHLVEFGHLDVRGGKRPTTRAGRATDKASLALAGLAGTRRVIGHVPAHPFLRPAWAKNKDLVLRSFADLVAEELVRTGNRWKLQVVRGKLGGGAAKAMALVA